jgi:FkbH-like protein
MKIAILSNTTITTLVDRFSKQVSPAYTTDGYDTWRQDLLNPGSMIYDAGLVFLLLDGYALLHKEDDPVAFLRELGADLDQAVSDHPDIRFFVSDLDIPEDPVHALNEHPAALNLARLWEDGLTALTHRINAFRFPLCELVKQAGRAAFYSPKMWYHGGMRFSMNAEKLLVGEMRHCFDAVQGKRKKALVLDLDNTLWGGVIGEDGMNGIALSDIGPGSRFQDFQSHLKRIKDTGVLLALCSKNNPDDALAVFREHPAMVLREDDFVAIRINWELKPVNIRAIAEELNIGIDSLVFVDDNPVEREMVKTALPEVEVPDFPVDTARLPEFADELFKRFFPILRLTDDDARKTRMYHENIEREASRRTARSHLDFLRETGTVITARLAGEAEIPRVSQLTNKTNQFNLTTIRYTEKEIAALVANPDTPVFTISVRDKFGDNGLVGVMILRLAGTEANVDTFLLSCRVMGRYIEDAFVTAVEDRLRLQGITSVVATYIPTPKNLPVAQCWTKLGYTTLSEAPEKTLYRLDLSNRPERTVLGYSLTWDDEQGGRS